MADSVMHTEHRTASPPLVQSAFSRRISWGALFAGVVVAVVVQMLLTVLGVGIGAATVSAQGQAGAGIGIGAGIWLAVSSIIAFYCAGWTAGRLAGIPRKVESSMHGFLTWGLSMVISSMLLTSAIGGLLGSATNLLGQAGGAAAGSAAAGGGGGQASDTLSGLADRASSTVQQQGGAEGIAQQAQQAVPEAAGGVAGASLAGFFIMLLGAGAGTLGGMVSTPKNTILTGLPAWERRGSAAR